MTSKTRILVNAPEFSLPDPSLNFLASEREIYDYADLYYFASQFAEKTAQYKLSEKKPLAILASSSDELVFVTAASFLLNIPIVALNPATTDSELQSQLAQVKAGLLFCDKESSSRIEHDHKLYVKKSELKSPDGTEHDLSHFSLGEPDSLFGYFFTSGSTGMPKVVPLKRRQTFFAAQASAENFRPDPNRYWLLCLPLNHIGGISIIFRSLLYHSAIYRMDKFDEHQVRTFLSENRLFQVASLVPTMLVRLLEDPLFQLHLDFKAILLGGGPISLNLITQSAERGIPIIASYGMTETCAQIAANPMLKPSGVYNPKRSVGMIFRPNEAQIRNPETGSPAPVNDSGLIWLRGPQVFDGYTDKELNKQVFDKDGWYNTGDFGRMNKIGQLFIENRRTDLIVTGGENVNPSEVEKLLLEFPGISEAAVLGIPDAHWGEKIVALLVPANGSKPDTDEIKSYLVKKLSGFKIPKEFYITGSLPKTDTEKLKRGELPGLVKKLQE